MSADDRSNVRAIVLSGGGARGAYEAGVLTAVAERAKGQLPIQIICGTSVGAITGAILAGALHDSAEVASRLETLWTTVALEDVLSFQAGDLLALPRLFLGGARPAGLFNGRKLAYSVARQIDFSKMREHLAAGRLHALTVSATHIPTGRPTVFIERRPDVPFPERIGRRVVVKDAKIELEHVLGSAAIPVLFAPVGIDGDLYCDGGLRLNTPIGPAIRLGAGRVLAVGLSTAKEDGVLPSGRYPAAAFLLGKVLNAFLLDHVMSDLDELYRINQFLADGTAVHGADFGERMGEVATGRGDPAYHEVDAYMVRPSEDLAVIAADHLRRMRRQVGRVSVGRVLLRLLDARETPGSDLASYLLFDGAYARDLIELGRQDGRAQAADIDAFLA